MSTQPTDADRERDAAAAMDAEDHAAAIDALIEGGSELAFRWHWARGAAYRGHQHWTGGESSEQFIGVDFAPYLAEAIEKVRASAYAQGRADEREACRELLMESARLTAENGDDKTAGTLQVVALAIITNGAVRDSQRAAQEGASDA